MAGMGSSQCSLTNLKSADMSAVSLSVIMRLTIKHKDVLSLKESYPYFLNLT